MRHLIIFLRENYIQDTDMIDKQLNAEFLLLKILAKTLLKLRLAKKIRIEKCELNSPFLEIESTNSLNFDA